MLYVDSDGCHAGIKARGKYVAAVAVVLVIGVAALLYFQYLPQLPETRPDEVTLQIIPTKESEVLKWRETLSYGKINHVDVWDPYGLSLKFKVIFEDGKVASGKFIEPFSWWPKRFRPFDFKSADQEHRRLSRRDWAEYQGYNELAAYHVALALGFKGKKPPTAGRFISNKQFYAEDTSLVGTLKRMLPEYFIPVTLIAWTDGLVVRPPNDLYIKMLGHDMPMNEEARHKALQVSDVMVFDYLLDDHDRIEAHNWLRDMTGQYIFWDSGLSFRHGPYGRRSRDRDIFCGRREWVEMTHNDERNCLRSCTFRKSTIERIYALTDEEPLSERVKRSMKSDPLFPVFHYNVYIPERARYPKVSYHVQNFFEGLDIRIQELHKYVDFCIEEFGEERVLIS